MKRHKNNVGKYIGGFLYFHKQYIDEINPNIHQVVADYLISRNGEEMKFNIVKYSLKSVAITFIYSPDFDTADEPYIQHTYRYNLVDDTWDYHDYGVDNNNPIYHHKWLFVKDDYKGFDVEAAKERSKHIETEMSRRHINRARIGYQKYWNTLNI